MKTLPLLALCLLAAAPAGSQSVARPAAPVRPPAVDARPIEVRLGFPKGTRLLILHDDDLGVDPAVNKAFIALADSGIRISGSIIAPAAFVPDLRTRVGKRADLDLGVHLALTSEWPQRRWGSAAPRGTVPTLLNADGFFGHPWTDSTRALGTDIDVELRAQIRLLRQRGFTITHLDSHELVLFRPDLFEHLTRVARDVRLPILQAREWVFGRSVPTHLSASPRVALARITTIEPDIPNAEWLDFYLKAVHDLPAGVSELIVHAALDEPSLTKSMPASVGWGAQWRIRDFTAIADPRFRAALRAEHVKLITWRDMQRVTSRE